MTDDPLESPEARAWRDARREAHVPAGFAARVSEARPRTAALPCGARAQDVPGLLRATAVAVGGAWLLARLAGLFLPFAIR
jgi:hypothetical protein